MNPISHRDLAALLEDQQSPCVSIYLPTRKGFPGNREGPRYFRSLVDQADETLTRKYPRAAVEPIRTKLRELGEDEIFWAGRHDGLAVLGSPGTFQVFDLARPVPERVIVGDKFHVKPLLRIIQSADQFHVLCLQRHASWSAIGTGSTRSKPRRCH